MNIPTLDEISALIAKVKAAAATITSKGASLGDKIGSALPVATALAEDLFPGATIAGFGVAEVLSVATSFSNAEPAIVAAVGNIEAITSGGAAPTAAEWAKFDAAADKAHTDFQSAVQAYINS